jgi:type IV secretory pathway VirB6-like protein
MLGGRYTHRWAVALCLIMAMALCVMLAPMEALASNKSQGNLFTGEGRCADITQTSGALMGLVIPCVTHSVEQATIRLTDGFAGIIRPVFYAFLVLVVTFFGVKVLQGEGQISREAFLLLLKIGIVITFINNFSSLTPAIYDAMEEGQAIVASAVLPETLYQNSTNVGGIGINITVTQENSNAIHCDFQDFQPQGASGVLWAQMDCLLGEVFGFAFGTGDRHNMVLGASILGMISGVLFGGTFGVGVFFAMVGFLFSIMLLVLRVGFAFLNAYIIAGIYIIISPLFIPLTLLKATASYFDRWWRGLAAAMLMPVLVTGYAIFAMLVYDKMLLAPDSLLNNLLDHQIFESASRGSKCYSPFGEQTNNQIAANTGVSREQMAMSSTFFGGVSQIFVGASQSVCVPNLDMEEYTPPDMSEGQFMSEIFFEMAKLLILAVIMQSGLKSVMGMISMVTGKASVGAALNPQQGREASLAASGKAFQQGVSGAMKAPLSDAEKDQGFTQEDLGTRGASGGLFIARFPGAIASGAAGFTSKVGGG